MRLKWELNQSGCTPFLCELEDGERGKFRQDEWMGLWSTVCIHCDTQTQTVGSSKTFAGKGRNNVTLNTCSATALTNWLELLIDALIVHLQKEKCTRKQIKDYRPLSVYITDCFWHLCLWWYFLRDTFIPNVNPFTPICWPQQVCDNEAQVWVQPAGCSIRSIQLFGNSYSSM